MSALTVTIAVLGKAHGLRGEISALLRTDQPEERLYRGAQFTVETDAGPRTLTVSSTRTQQDRWYLRFDEVTDRTDAESLRGVTLTQDVDTEIEAEEDPDAWYLEELKGLSVRHVEDERELGTVIGLEHYPAQDLLIVRSVEGQRVMLPFVEELVPEVNVADGIVLADPPGGLFETLNEDQDA